MTKTSKRAAASRNRAPVLGTCPTGLGDGNHLKAFQVASQELRKVFVQKHAFHATRANRACVACSKKLLSCSRRTLGKLSTNSLTL